MIRWTPTWHRLRAIAIMPLLLAGATGCGDAEPPLPDTPARTTVELFAPNVVSTELPEFATSFSPSGDTVYFNRTPADRSRIDLLYSVLSDGRWSEARTFEALSGIRAVDPFVSPDGRVLYYSSNQPRPGGLEGSYNLWRLDLRQVGAEPEALPEPINSDSSDIFNAVSRAGTMVFSSLRDGTRRVYEVQLTDELDTAPTVVAFSRDAAASNPVIDPDGQMIVFARVNGDSRPDLFLSCRGDRGWGDPVRLPEPINTAFTEFAPGFGPEHLYFTSERPGVAPAVPEGVRPPGDIYRTPLAEIRTLCGR